MKREGMPPPPAGSVQLASIGDLPAGADPNSSQHASSPDMVNIACLLTGSWPHPTPALRQKVPDLSERYVEHLYAGVSRFMPPNIPWRFTCFTDREPQHMPGIPTHKLPGGYNGWFNKLYLFSPEAYPAGARVLYFDLDTAITGNLARLATASLDVPILLRDVWASAHAASGVMSFRAGPALHPVWAEFRNRGLHPPPYTAVAARLKAGTAYQEGKGRMIRTDEQWLHQYLYPDNWAGWQDIFGETALVSYKKNILGMNSGKGWRAPRGWKPADTDTSVVYFHGVPRPHDVVVPWQSNWRGVHDRPQGTAVAAHRIEEIW